MGRWFPFRLSLQHGKAVVKANAGHAACRQMVREFICVLAELTCTWEVFKSLLLVCVWINLQRNNSRRYKLILRPPVTFQLQICMYRVLLPVIIVAIS